MQNLIGWLMQFGPWGFIGLGLAFFAVLALLGMYSAQQRTKAMLELSESLGFSFMPRANVGVVQAMPPFQLFSQGRSQRVDNLLSGSTQSTEVQIFDWSYVTGHGKHAHHHKTTAVVIHAADLDLPAFYLRPETVFDWVGLTFDGKDIDFEDRPVFSKKFHLHGNLEQRIRALFDVEVCDFFEAHVGIYTEGQRQWLLYYLNDQLVPPAKLQERFEDAFRLYLLLKVRSEESASQADSAPAVTDQSRDEMSTEAE